MYLLLYFLHVGLLYILHMYYRNYELSLNGILTLIITVSCVCFGVTMVTSSYGAFKTYICFCFRSIMWPVLCVDATTTISHALKSQSNNAMGRLPWKPLSEQSITNPLSGTGYTYWCCRILSDSLLRNVKQMAMWTRGWQSFVLSPLYATTNSSTSNLSWNAIGLSLGG